MANEKLNRRGFLKTGTLAVLGSAGGLYSGVRDGRAGVGRGSGPATTKPLEINRILVQRTHGRRATPVAPNSYAGYRGYNVSELLVRIQTVQGLEGVAELYADPNEKKSTLARLIGVNPFDLFEWQDGRIVEAHPDHRELVESLYGIDIAVLDLLGKALQKPVADLLGERVRQSAAVYDSSLYMEDLLTPEQSQNLAYLDGPAPGHPADMVAKKARWVVSQPHGIRILKIKVGRAKWMDSFESALMRDIEVTRRVREAVGDHVILFVDGNHGYNEQPEAVKRFLEGSRDTDLYAMEEMFSQQKLDEWKQIKRFILGLASDVKLADGEVGGLPERILADEVETEQGKVRLFDINQPDMNWHGYLRLRRIATTSRKYGIQIAPHNFGSEIGVYTQAHIAMVTPNWEFCESDDSEFPAIEPTGVALKDGKLTLKGEPGLGIKVHEEHLEAPVLKL